MTDLFNPALAPTVEPVEFVAGDLVMWRRTDLAAYISGYTLGYTFRPAGGGPTPTNVVATVSGSEFRVAMAAAVTSLMTAGRWTWQSYLTRTSDSARVGLGNGLVQVLPNLVTETGDTRSHARKMLDAIEAVMAGRATHDVASYTIGGRQINKISPDDLIKWRAYYQAQVAQEDDLQAIQDGKKPKNTIQIVFRG